MKTNAYKLIKKIFFLLFISITICFNAMSQPFTNSIDIGSALQQPTNAANYDTWLVTAMSTMMTSAVYSGTNTGTPPGGTVAGLTGPVLTTLPQPALQPGFAGSPGGISCYPTNTIYTPVVTANNFTNYTMNIQRRFYVCGTDSVAVTFNFNVFCDDGIQWIRVDNGGTVRVLENGQTAAITPYVVNQTINLAPGDHTVDIQVYDWQQPTGQQQSVSVGGAAGVNMQWNPFMVIITGNITTAGSALINGNGPAAIPPITGPTNVCWNDTIHLSNSSTDPGDWSSSNTGIATVDNTGIVTGVQPGNVTIYFAQGVGNCRDTVDYNITVDSCHCEDPCSWSLTGNLNVLNRYFIGPINDQDFRIRTNNTQKMVVKSNGNVGIGTGDPQKLLHVEGEARIKDLPAPNPDDRVVFANGDGDLKALDPGASNQYLSGNGTWQDLPGGTTLTATQGLVIDDNVVMLGDQCYGTRGTFTSNRQVNVGEQNLYFNATTGKIFMGNVIAGDIERCRDLETRLEIETRDLSTDNGYSGAPSPSGLRFTNLTSEADPITNRTRGVLSLDAQGDVIWVTACCRSTGLGEVDQLKINSIEDRLNKLEAQLKNLQEENTALKSQLTKTDVFLSNNNTIVLNQNVPNPFAEKTMITYTIPQNFKTAQLIFSTTVGEIIKTVDIKQSGKGMVNVFAGDISSGLYTYTLVVDGKKIDTKKMIRQ